MILWSKMVNCNHMEAGLTSKWGTRLGNVAAKFVTQKQTQGHSHVQNGLYSQVALAKQLVYIFHLT